MVAGLDPFWRPLSVEGYGYLTQDHDANSTKDWRNSPWKWFGSSEKPVYVEEYDLDILGIKCAVGERCLIGPYVMRRLPLSDPRPLALFMRDEGLWRLWLVRLRFRAWRLKTKVRLIKTAVIWGLADYRQPLSAVDPGQSILKWWFQKGS